MDKYRITYNKPGAVNAEKTVTAKGVPDALTRFYMEMNLEGTLVIEVVSVKNLRDGKIWRPSTGQETAK